MANVGQLLKSEISRIARREIGAEVKALRKITAEHRRVIADLRRRLSAVESGASLILSLLALYIIRGNLRVTGASSIFNHKSSVIMFIRLLKDISHA